MTILNNQITINAPLEKIWTTLTTIDLLAEYDPTVKSSVKTGIHRKVVMRDGKNWFEEKMILSNKQLSFELTACSFPVDSLRHDYSFEQQGEAVIVKQVMTYQIKFGWFGRLLDSLMIRKQTNNGIRLFLEGLKSYCEKL